MIILELICAAGSWIWYNILKPLIRFPYWIITARDCQHCKHYAWWNRCDHCDKYDSNCCFTACYQTITRKDFKRK